MKRHECKLLQPARVSILNEVIDTGMFINLRRFICRLRIISPSHPMTSVYYNSHRAKLEEEVRQLVFHRWLIHPYSLLAMYWEFFVFLVYSILLINLSIMATINVYNRQPTPIVVVKMTMDYVMTIDIVKTFFTGYYDTAKSKTIMDSRLIAKKYLRSYFFLDLACCLHSYLIPFRMFSKNTNFLDKTFILSVALRTLSSLRIIRIRRGLDTLQVFEMYANLSSALNRAFRNILTFVILLLWLFGMIFQIGIFIGTHFIPEEERDIGDTVPKVIYSTTLMLLHASFGDRNLNNPVKIIFSLVVMAVGYCLQIFLYTLVLQVWIRYSNAKIKNENLYQQFTEYLNYKRLPMSLRKKFFSFYHFKFENQFYNEAHINRMISTILRREIMVHVTKNHVQRVEFFQNLPDVVLSRIVSRLKSEIYLTNDVIINAGVTGTCMFFIYFGTVTIYTPSGREICHLEDGAHFGEIALIFNEPRVATVVAVTPCELFVLNRSDFLDVLRPFPELIENITKLAEERLRTTVFQ
ncbi:unnamed protein product [Phaedon cochleariae]|uniref:Cyclic nucleotide-binding domain-containing protein n=1 Tax=Phaedon cochleariae TaxID=80249 RepID=A0A9P0GWX4_PHACE|nr:unnamed protein product [Phaedon cochleariae]